MHHLLFLVPSCSSMEHSTNRMEVSIFNFNLFCVHLIHRGYDPSDMELVNTE